MHSITVQHASLTDSDISSILNLVCPGCGGPLGGASNEFQCQGHCRKDWRSDWESNGLSRSPKRRSTAQTASRWLIRYRSR